MEQNKENAGNAGGFAEHWPWWLIQCRNKDWWVLEKKLNWKIGSRTEENEKRRYCRSRSELVPLCRLRREGGRTSETRPDKQLENRNEKESVQPLWHRAVPSARNRAGPAGVENRWSYHWFRLERASGKWEVRERDVGYQKHHSGAGGCQGQGKAFSRRAVTSRLGLTGGWKLLCLKPGTRHWADLAQETDWTRTVVEQVSWDPEGPVRSKVVKWRVLGIWKRFPTIRDHQSRGKFIQIHFVNKADA